MGALGATNVYAQANRAAAVKQNRALIYHGKLVRPDGRVPQGTLPVTITILSPDPKLCVLWKETQNVALDNGAFAMEIGHSVNRVGGAVTEFKNAFVNNPSAAPLVATCKDGSTSYTPGATDDRLLSAAFSDGSEIVEVSGMPIKSVPYALHAEELAGFGIANLVKISGAGSGVTLTPLQIDELQAMSDTALPFDMKTRKVKNVGVPVDPTDATTKTYVDNAISGAVISAGAGTVTSVSVAGGGLSVSSGTTTPTVSLAQANATTSGYLTSADWNTFNGKQAALGFTPISNALATGQVYLGVAGVATASNFGIGQMRNGAGTLQFPTACAASQTLTWSAVTDVLVCSNIDGLDAGKITTGNFAAARLGSGTADATKYLRGDGTWQTLPSGADHLGNHTATQNLNLASYQLVGNGGSSGISVTNAGDVGVGTTTPGQKLSVAGTIESTSGGFRFPDGSTQTTAATGGGGGGAGPSFHVHRNGTSSGGFSVLTKVTWTTESYDTNNNFASSRFTPTVAGKYLIIFSVECWNNTTNCQAAIYKNGSLYSQQQLLNVPMQTTQVTSVIDFNGTTDYVEAYVRNADTGDIYGDPTKTYFSGSQLSPMVSGTIAGTGTANSIPYWTSGTNLGNSPMFVNSGNVGIGTATPGEKLEVVGGKIKSPEFCIGASCITAWPSGGGGGGVSSVSVAGGALSVANGTSTPEITLNQATTSASGYLASTDWNTFNGKQSTSLATNQVWVGNGSSVAAAQYFGLGQLRSTATGSAQFPAACSANQTMVWSAITDVLACSNIDGLNADKITAGTVATARLGSGTADNTKYLRGDGTWQTLPSGADNLGNHTATANVNLATNKLVGNGGSLGLEISSTGTVGIGVTPGALYNLELNATNSRNFGMQRNSSGQGFPLNITAGGAASGGTDLAGGNLQLRSGYATGSGSSEIQFFTAQGLTSGALDRIPVQRMVLTGAGNLGIGTTTPSEKIDVSGKVKATEFCIGASCLTAWPSAGSGDVVGPASSTDNAVARFDTTTGKLLQNSGVTIDDSNNVTGINNLTAANNLTVDTNTLVVDATNNRVGIGTSTPSTGLHVLSAAGSTTAATIAVTGMSSKALAINTSNLSSVGVDITYGTAGAMAVNATSSSSGAIGFNSTNSGSTGYGVKSVVSGAGGFGVYGETSGTNGYGVYGKNSNAFGYAGYFDAPAGGYGLVVNTGNVGIGTTTPSAALHVVGDIKFTGVLTDISDERTKENVRPLEDAIRKITSLEGRSYNMIDDRTKRVEYGFLAQAVRKVFPALVVEDENGMLSVNYLGFIAPIVEAIKGQQKEIDELRAQSAELRRQNEELRERLERLESR